MTVRRSLFITGTLLLSIALVGCSSFWSSPYRQGSSSSLVEYLYPQGARPEGLAEEIPEITVPARIGLAFVPGTGGSRITQAQKIEVLDEVRSHFAEHRAIDHIQVIPDSYLSTRGGFTELEQLARLYDVELMALVSHDQVASSDDNAASLLYWTIVGAYVIEGTGNTVSTFVDTAIFDVASRKLLFRAPGRDERKRRSTAVRADENSQRLARESLQSAMQEMTINLDAELEEFATRIQEDQSVRLVSRSGGVATGSSSLIFLGLLMLGLLLHGRGRLQ